MADNSSNNSSGSRNWRERVGVKGGMPKLADEFKNEPTASPGSRQPGSGQPAPRQNEPSRQAAPVARPQGAPQAPSSSPAQAAPGKPGQPGQQPAAPLRPVARPAPMAPRRPVTPAPLAPQRHAGAPTGGNDQQDTAFGDRLRAQREAAEALAKKRSEETRNRLSGAADSGSGPKFSFAAEEIKAAEQEKGGSQRPVPIAAPPGAPTRAPARPVVPPRPTPAPPTPSAPTSAAPTPPRAPFRPTHTPAPGTFPKPYQPSDAYRQTHGYREYEDQRTPPPREQHAEAGQGEARDAYTPRYAPAGRHEYQAPQSRDPRQGREGNDYDDGLFDDQQDGGYQPPRRADASEYTAAYRDYDDAFDYEEEPRSRGGIWIFVVLMLIVVTAIAAGAYWFINYGTKIGAEKAGNGKVPTVSAPENPVKVAPKPVDTTTPGAPVRRKKIYDRILGNQTLEPEKLAPSEETPLTPPTPAPTPAPEAAPTNNSPIGVEPLPLPLPPPPTVPGVQGSVTPKTNKVARLSPVNPAAGKTGQTTIAPTSASAAKQNTSSTQAGGQQAPLPLPGVGNAETTATPPVSAPDSNAAPPLPRAKPDAVIARARQAAEQDRLAALTRSVTPPPSSTPLAPRTTLQGGSGPVQLGSGNAGSQNFNGAAPVAPRAPGTNFASLPPATQPQITQPSRQPVAPQPQATTGGGFVLQMSSFRNRNAASSEYRRLISRHASVLRGLSPEIREADLGASGKFYKLRLGSVADRSQAARLCNALIAAGEKDCLVRSR